MIMNIRKDEPEGDEYIIGPYLRQRVENPWARSNQNPWE